MQQVYYSGNGYMIYRIVKRVNPKCSNHKDIFFLFPVFLLYLYEVTDVS